jgi:hypothetical protein
MIIGLNTAGLDWQMLRTWATKEVARLGAELEGQVQHDQTQYLRGQIAMLRTILSEDGQNEIPRTEPVNYES